MWHADWRPRMHYEYRGRRAPDDGTLRFIDLTST
jgi:hypothetical protein